MDTRKYPGWNKPENKEDPEWYTLYCKWLDEMDNFYDEWYKKIPKGAKLLDKIEYEGKRKIEQKYCKRVFDLLHKYKKEYPEEFTDIN